MTGGFFMMFDSVLVKVSCSEELLYLHTISRRHKSPYRFAILRDTLEQLEREPGRQIIVADCGCYAALRLTRALDGENKNPSGPQSDLASAEPLFVLSNSYACFFRM